MQYLFLSTLQFIASNTTSKCEGSSIVDDLDQMADRLFLAGHYE